MRKTQEQRANRFSDDLRYFPAILPDEASRLQSRFVSSHNMHGLLHDDV